MRRSGFSGIFFSIIALSALFQPSFNIRPLAQQTPRKVKQKWKVSKKILPKNYAQRARSQQSMRRK
jgi:hypothetical protein